MRRITYLLTIAIFFLVLSCQQHRALSGIPLTSDLCDFHTGDLIFVCDTTGMGSAIQSSTGDKKDQHVFTHVAIAECTDSGIYVIDATPRLGVSRRTLGEFILSVTRGDPDRTFTQYAYYYQVAVPFDTLLLQRRLKAFVGQPYDHYFMPDNGRMYCSELVYECFFDCNGHHLFPVKPMNFKAADGSMPLYWQEHFGRLGTAIPQDMPGTNPNDMSKSPILRPFKIE